MGMTKTYKFVCNLCEDDEENESGDVPIGWLDMLIENFMGGGFKQKHVCGDCVNEIHTRHRKNNKLDV